MQKKLIEKMIRWILIFENSVLIAPVTGCEVRDCVSAGGFKSS